MHNCIVCKGPCSVSKWKRHKHALNDLFCTEICYNGRGRKGECPYGDRCQFAHGQSELRKQSSGTTRYATWKTRNLEARSLWHKRSVYCRPASTSIPTAVNKQDLSPAPCVCTEAKEMDSVCSSLPPSMEAKKAEDTTAQSKKAPGSPPEMATGSHADNTESAYGSEDEGWGAFAESILRVAICE